MLTGMKMGYFLLITVFGNLILMMFKNYRTVLGVVAPTILILLSFVIFLTAKFSIAAFIIAIYVNLILFLFSVFVIIHVSRQNSDGIADDFTEYWLDDNNVTMKVGIRVFTTRVTKMIVWQRDKGRCIKCGSNQDLEFKYNIPCSKGGSNTHINIHLVCQNCSYSSVEIIQDKILRKG